MRYPHRMETSTTSSLTKTESHDAPVIAETWGVVVLWSRNEPARIGEWSSIPEGSSVLGRGSARDGEPYRCTWMQQRPGRNRSTGPLRGKALSRTQLAFEADDDSLLVRNIGRAPLRGDGFLATGLEASVGTVLEVEDRLLLLVDRRPSRLEAPLSSSRAHHPFGEADAFGMVGETPQMWQMRDRVDFLAPRPVPVLVHGPSGSGKELVARALHLLSPRGRHRLVARNAATLPETLIDAELFGNVADYPNAGMPGRPGIVGEAEGGTLFLDEIGEISHGLQTHLLRLLDDGEYQQLGDARTLRADIRLIAATNRSPNELRADLRARLRASIALPGLCERRADIPFLAQHRLATLAQGDPVVSRFLDDDGRPRWTAGFVSALVSQEYLTNVRGLEALLWDAMAACPSGVLAPYAGLPNLVSAQAHEDGTTDPGAITEQAVRTAMDRHGGVREKVWRELGLRNRYQLRRLLTKFGLTD